MEKIAVSKSDFEEIRENNFIYVDKTEYLYKIVNSKEPYYFLSRPRRFGKTLFLDTLKTFFEGKKELFEGLYVHDQKLEWKEHPIIKLDFNKLPSENRKLLEKGIRERLLKIAKQYSIDLKEEKAYFMFPNLIEGLSKKYNKGVVVLVDEYDKPINNISGKDNLKIAQENKKFMKIFYDNLKALESDLRLVFMTGVSKFSKTSIFSTLNNLIEIDKEPIFAEILGYTEEELHSYFAEHFEKLAAEKNSTLREVKENFRQMYNGFRFTEKDTKVYNPYSSGKALAYSRLDNYWFESGTPKFLVDLIKERDFDVTNLSNVEIGRDEIKSYDLGRLQLIPLLFQTGYLTIKDIEDEIIYTLSYPNHEVEQGFSLNLIKSLSEDKIKTPVIHKIKKSLLESNYKQFISYMKSLFANIPNLIIPSDVQQREDYYHSIFYLTGVLLTDNNLGVSAELLTSKGRIDMAVETEKNIFIIEFKCDQSSEKAIEQIKENDYKEKFKKIIKKLSCIGINFSTEKRNVEDFTIEKS